LSPQTLLRRAVSVVAHYREPRILRKAFLKKITKTELFEQISSKRPVFGYFPYEMRPLKTNLGDQL
ncbi:hypothetical protein, partial [Aliagarivorans marinus]|uniref:hypothetical protein n=1 Tax=Aliagarivorans marinus TaxID=561965 RepID=UPI001B7FA49D